MEALSKKDKIAYGFGAVGKDMVYMLSSSYVLYYYQDILGVSAIAMGILLMIARIFDAFNDPIMGVVVAKTRTKFGKFRPWVFVGTLFNAVILYCLFAAPPSWSKDGIFVYVSFIYVFWGLTYTMMDIPFWSMIPAFTKAGKERESLTTLARSCAGVGAALVTVCTIICVGLLGNGSEQVGFRRFAFIVAIIFIIAEVIMCIKIKEKPTVNIKPASVRDMIKTLLKNDQAIVVVVVIVLINTASYITTNLIIYYFKYDYIIDWNTNYTIFNSFGGAVQILSMMIFYPWLRKFISSEKVFESSIVMSVLGYSIMLILVSFGVTNMAILLIPAFFVFAGFGMLLVLVTICLANSVDYGEVKYKTREESVIFSMQTFVVKLASGIGIFISSLCLSIAHISKDESSNEILGNEISMSSKMILRMFMTMVPIVILLVAFTIFKNKYKLTDKKMEEITQTLQNRNKSKSK